MKQPTDQTDDQKPEESAAVPSKKPEAANIAVRVLKPGTKIGKAICGKGPCSIPLTASQAQALEDLGKVKIIGVF